MSGEEAAGGRGRRGARAAAVNGNGAPVISGLTFVKAVGSGGYADVFLYQQEMPRMPVAVKVLKSEGVTDSIRHQFTAEANTMAQLADHPYIVQVFGAGVADDGRPYLVMKYYPPPNLSVRVRERQFSVQEVLRTGIQLASAVETAHRAGITHRDIKPANVLLTQYGDPGLTDFGIAGRGARDDDPEEDLGVSVPWAPPEVLFGHTSGDVRSDVYSLGATLWHLLVGRSPFEVPGGDNSAYALMPRIRSTPVPQTHRQDVPVSLERLLDHAMAKDPSMRPASALALARALQGIEQDERFSRTPIVVLDERGHSTLEGGGSGPPRSGPGPAGSGDGDATRVRAPQRVQAQGRAHTDDLTRPRSVPPRPAERTADVVTADTPSLGSGAGGGVAAGEDATTRTRPPRSRPGGTAAGAAEEAATPPGGSHTTLLLGLVALLVAVLVAVVVVLLVQRGGSEADTPTPQGTVSGPSDTDAVDTALPAEPTLEARPEKGRVLFHWSYPELRKDDTYHVIVRRSADALDEAIRTRAFTTVEGTTRQVEATKGQQRCARVQVVRRGVAGPWSEPTCERAG